MLLQRGLLAVPVAAAENVCLNLPRTARDAFPVFAQLFQLIGDLRQRVSRAEVADPLVFAHVEPVAQGLGLDVRGVELPLHCYSETLLQIVADLAQVAVERLTGLDEADALERDRSAV